MGNKLVAAIAHVCRIIILLRCTRSMVFMFEASKNKGSVLRRELGNVKEIVIFGKTLPT